MTSHSGRAADFGKRATTKGLNLPSQTGDCPFHLRNRPGGENHIGKFRTGVRQAVLNHEKVESGNRAAKALGIRAIPQGVGAQKIETLDSAFPDSRHNTVRVETCLFRVLQDAHLEKLAIPPHRTVPGEGIR